MTLLPSVWCAPFDNGKPIVYQTAEGTTISKEEFNTTVEFYKSVHGGVHLEYLIDDSGQRVMKIKKSKSQAKESIIYCSKNGP